jgi:hypothetical protein
MIKVGDVISYWDMCKEEGSMIQRGMNFRLRSRSSVVLMSVRRGAPYADRVEDNGRVLIYEGHDMPKRDPSTKPKEMDQPMHDKGKLSQNGLFFEAAENFKHGEAQAELVKVYEKVRPGIWTYNGYFRLVDAWQETTGARSVFKFRLEVAEGSDESKSDDVEVEHPRIIPTPVKLEVWNRDKGQCTKCGSQQNLHFDHVIPYSKGGSSLSADNIQLLCSKCNIAKRDRIQ